MIITKVKDRYVLAEEFIYKHSVLVDIEYCNAWCTIAGGSILVRPGYAWDGCSPKYDIAGLITIGTPDGRLHEGWPITYHSSLVHDVFCQFRLEIPISKDSVLKIFNDMLAEKDFSARVLYVTAVDWFGPQEFAG